MCDFNVDNGGGYTCMEVRGMWIISIHPSQFCFVPKTVLLKVFVLFCVPWWFSGEESPYSAGDLDSIPVLERCPGEL